MDAAPALDQLATPVLWLKGDGRIAGANPACARWLGVSLRRLPGLPLAALEAEGDALARVKDRIRHDLQDGAPSLEEVASGLKMSARTLQRRLGAHDLQFSALVDETRRELAEDHLAHSNLALAEVAFVLGYADLATFIRAFKRWTGQTPKAFRERAQRGG